MTSLGAVFASFFHAPQSTLPVGVFRIAFGCLVFIHLLLMARDAPCFFYPSGLGSASGRWSRLNPLSLLPFRPGTVRFLLGLGLTSAISLTVGFATPVSAALVFFSYSAIVQKNADCRYGGDTVILLYSFLLVLAPPALPCSVDRAIFRHYQVPVGDVADPWALRLMQLQVAAIYLASVYWKLKGESWRDGSASYYVWNLLHLRRLPAPVILQRRSFYRACTWMTLLTEGLFATLVWFRPFRAYAIMAAVAFHIGLEITLNVNLFNWVMVTLLLLFLDGGDLRAFFAWCGSLMRGCPLARQVSRALSRRPRRPNALSRKSSDR